MFKKNLDRYYSTLFSDVLSQTKALKQGLLPLEKDSHPFCALLLDMSDKTQQ